MQRCYTNLWIYVIIASHMWHVILNGRHTRTKKHVCPCCDFDFLILILNVATEAPLLDIWADLWEILCVLQLDKPSEVLRLCAMRDWCALQAPELKIPIWSGTSGDLLECFTALHFQLFIIFFCVCIFSLCTLLIRIKKGTMKTTNCPMTTSEDQRYICMVNARRPPTFQT